jgi:predicted dehydrogenase
MLFWSYQCLLNPLSFDTFLILIILDIRKRKPVPEIFMNRRSLLKKLAVTGTSVTALPSSVTAMKAENSKDGRIGYAILGLGNFASYVVPRLKYCTKSKIAALISSDPLKAKQWAGQYQLGDIAIYHYDDFDKVRKNQSVDAVYIATPVGTHAHFAQLALSAGKHVLTEKTMAASVEQGQQMIDAARLANRKLMVAYRARFEPYNQACIDFVRDETFGKVTSITAHKGFAIGDQLGKNQWRISKTLAGGGALMDIGIYSIQACRYLAGMEPIEVFAFSTSTPNDQRFFEVEEDISFTLRFPNGILATGSASWSYSLQNYFRVGGSKGYFELEPATSNMNLRMQVKQENPTLIGERFYPAVDQIPAMFDHFSNCILENSEPKTAGTEGLKDLQVIDAIYQSIREKRPVTL